MKIISFLSLVTTATTLASAAVRIQSELRSDPDTVPDAFIIEFQEGFDYTKSSIFRDAKAGHSFDIRHQYSVFNGISIQIKSGHNGGDLAGMRGVKRVWPVRRFQHTNSRHSNNEHFHPHLASSHEMTGVNFIRETFRYTGKGIKVAVIDSGIDYTHPAFGGCSGVNNGTGCRVVAGHNFIDGKDPMDCDGHGTHIAGIIGGDARNASAPQAFVGVAPAVEFGAYKVLPCGGKASDDDIMKAMERALQDGMNIINLSLGNGPNFKSHPIAVLADELVKNGMSVVGSAGNSGADGVWGVEEAGLGDFSTSVASFDNIRIYSNFFKYGGKDYNCVFSKGWGGPLDRTASTTLVPILNGSSLSDGCAPDSYAHYNVSGKIVLVGEGTCNSSRKGTTAKGVGAAGILRSSDGTLTSLPGIDGFPMAFIEARVVPRLLADHRQNNSTVFQWFQAMEWLEYEGGGAPSYFSSWGPDGDLRIKPDISAPGGYIFSTFPRANGSYYVDSGTSMAAPYIAGAHALLLEHNRSLSGQDIRRILMNTAIPGRFLNHTKLAPVAKQGSGLVNITNAINVKTSFSPDRIELLDTTHVTSHGINVSVTINNLGGVKTNYNLTHEAAESVISYRGGNTFPLASPIIGNDYANVTFSQHQVVVEAGQSANITVHFKEPSTDNRYEFPLYSGYIIATPDVENGVPVRIPYAGLKGNVGKVPILDTNSSFPKLVVYDKNADCEVPVKEYHEVDWASEELYIDVRLGSSTPELSISLHSNATNATSSLVGYLKTWDGIAAFASGRNVDVAREFHSVRWINGEVFADRHAKNATVPPSGEYRVVVTAQRKLSKGKHPKDFEIHKIGIVNISDPSSPGAPPQIIVIPTTL